MRTGNFHFAETGNFNFALTAQVVSVLEQSDNFLYKSKVKTSCCGILVMCVKKHNYKANKQEVIWGILP